MFSVLLKKAASRFPLVSFTAEANTTDLQTLASLIQSKKIKSYIDRSYSFKDIPAAITYIEAMHTRGKVVMVWDDTTS
jgi:NADPH:quinone reductase-like Zn-dependent oxidoreductase